MQELSKNWQLSYLYLQWIISLYFLVGGFNPFEKYARQNGFIFPKDRGENSKNLWNHLRVVFCITLPETNIAHENPHLSW